MPARRPAKTIRSGTSLPNLPNLRGLFYEPVGGGTTVPLEPISEDWEKHQRQQAPCPLPPIVAPLWVVQEFRQKKSVYRVLSEIRDRLLRKDRSITLQQARCLINDLARHPEGAEAVQKLVTPKLIARLLGRRS